MAWNRVVGQERVKTLLQKAIIENRIAHSYCFWGEEGVGKEALAIEFAKTVNCSSPQIEGSAINACGKCSSCLSAESLQHPNISMVFALPAGKGSDSSDSPLARLSDEQINNIQEQIAHKANNYYHKIVIPNATQIKIASIRELKKQLSFASQHEGRRVIIISNADDMTTESANAFLKTLEEPNDNVTIIMTTSRREAILPTILSRCQQVRCEPLSDDEVIEVLVNVYNYPPEKVRLITAFAQGSITRAQDFMDDEIQLLREEVINILRISLKKKIYRNELTEAINEITKEKDKNKVEIFLTLLLIWFRDVIALSRTGSADTIINADQIDTLKKFVDAYAKYELNNCIISIEKSFTRLSRNVSPQLFLLSLYLSLRATLTGR